MARYIFITGGVVSSLGKGLMAASLAALCRRADFVSHPQIRPLSQCRSGYDEPLSARRSLCHRRRAETDLDLGHYERFTGVSARQADNITSGGFTATSSSANGVAIIWAQRCK